MIFSASVLADGIIDVMELGRWGYRPLEGSIYPQTYCKNTSGLVEFRSLKDTHTEIIVVDCLVEYL